MNNENQKQPFLFPNLEIVKHTAGLIAIPIYAVLHSMCGYRFSKATIPLINAVALTVFGILCPEFIKPFPCVFFLFPWAVVVAGCVQRQKRWRELQRRQTWHSYCDGISYISHPSIRWPEWLRRESRLVRFVEPLIVLVIGGLIGLLVSRALGLYLIVVAACMATFQGAIYDKWINDLLDALDNQIRGESMSLALRALDPKNAGRPAPTIMDFQGHVPPSISAELIEIINMKRATQGPDNLYR